MVWCDLFAGGTSPDFDFLNLEDIVDGPYDAEEAAHDDNNDLERIAPRGLAEATSQILVDCSCMNDVHS